MMNNATEPELLTYQQVADICQVNVRTIMNAVHDRQLTVIYITERNPRIRRADLEQYLAKKAVISQEPGQ